MFYGERIRELRKEKKMTLRDLSDELEIPFTTLGNYERGDRQPNFETIRAIAEFFNVSVDYLIGRENIRNDEELSLHTNFGLLRDLLRGADPKVRELVTELFNTLYQIVTNNQYRVPELKEIELLSTVLKSISIIKQDATYMRYGVKTPHEYATTFINEKERMDISLNELFHLLIKKEV